MCLYIHMYINVYTYIIYTCIHIELFILQVLACFVQVTPASSLHSTSSSGKSIAEGINDLLSDNHWLTGTEVEAQHVRAMLQETAAQCRTPDTVCQTFVIHIHRHKRHAFTKYTNDYFDIQKHACKQIYVYTCIYIHVPYVCMGVHFSIDHVL